MKHCPTCGQPVLPSMGEKTARQVNAAQARPQTSTPTTNEATIKLIIGNSISSPKTETTPRGYKTQHVIKRDQRYRIRINLISFPRRGTIGGKLTIAPLGTGTENKGTPTTHELPEQPTIPLTPHQHEFQITAKFEDQIPVKIILEVGA